MNTQRRFCYLWRAAVAILCILSMQPYGSAIAQVFHDDFDVFHDYTSGAVPAGGIWDGIHNPTNGGDPNLGPDFKGFFVADGADSLGNPKSGVLFIEDLNLHPNTNGSLGIGWEANRNNAPFLYRHVPSQQNFDAVMKISSQTAGQWSYSSVIARAAGTPVGLGLGDTLDANESFITMGNFRASAVVPEAVSLLIQNVVNRNETELNPSFQSVLPLWIRMTKRGSLFTAYSSNDGSNWTERGNRTNVQLNQAGETLEVGLSFMMFGGIEAGETEIDYFDLTIIPEPATCALLAIGVVLLIVKRR